MFIAVSVSKIKKFLYAAAAAIICTVTVITFKVTEKKQVILCSDSQSRIDFLAEHGIDATEISYQDITIPFIFNDVYADYAQLQKTQGFDLYECKGKSAQMYTYSIADSEDTVTLLIIDGRLSAADRYSENIMYPVIV